jgi:hypothetical protein
MAVKLDVTGERYGRLVGIKSLVKQKGHSLWLWKCDCGNQKSVLLVNVRRGLVKSCGCLNIERLTKHGMSNHWLYSTFCGIKNRCNNPKNKKYPLYGGRDIRCLFNTFEEFSCYVQTLPNFSRVQELGLSVNRIDNEGNYKVGNLEWASYQKQEANKRLSKNNTSGYEGVGYIKKRNKWGMCLQISGRKAITGSYDTLEEAIRARKKAEQEYRATLIV